MASFLFELTKFVWAALTMGCFF